MTNRRFRKRVLRQSKRISKKTAQEVVENELSAMKASSTLEETRQCEFPPAYRSYRFAPVQPYIANPYINPVNSYVLNQTQYSSTNFCLFSAVSMCEYVSKYSDKFPNQISWFDLVSTPATSYYQYWALRERCTGELKSLLNQEDPKQDILWCAQRESLGFAADNYKVISNIFDQDFI